MKKVFVAILAIVMIVTGMIGTDCQIQAATGAAIIITNDPDATIKPGETQHIKVGIKATTAYVYNPTIELSVADTAPITVSKPTLTWSDAPINYVTTSTEVYLEFDVKAKDTAKIGTYPIEAKFIYNDFLNGTDGVTTSISTSIKVTEEKNPAQLTVGNVELNNTNIGNDTKLTFTVKNEGELTAKNAYLTMNFGDFIEEEYTAKDIKIGDLAAGETQNITLPVSILSTATIGRKTITANFVYKSSEGTELKASYNIYVNLTSAVKETKAPKLNITNMNVPDSLKQSDKFPLSVDIENIGGADAENIQVSIDSASVDATGILKNYFTDNITTDDMISDASTTVTIPLEVSKYATGGLKAVKVVIAYTDDEGKAYTSSDTVYIDIAASTIIPTPVADSANLVISNVVQTPSQPVAGEKVEISFDVENKGKVDANELKISTEGLTSATFIPVESEPYLYYETLKAGKKLHVTIPLVVSTSIVEGLNSITVKCAYAGGGESTANIPIRDVINDGGISKPKLIISKYTTDTEELRAGSTFKFTFDVYNTNASVAAKNITLTVSQADNIFTVTQGSNSFFINKIAPGETVSETLEMKVKSDASTKAYPIEILIEYEYDGAKANPTTGDIGEKRTEKLNLQAVENARPVIDNVNVYSFDGNVVSGTPATLSFEFYNMGRSPLNNVIARVEGDFTKTDGDMYFLGNAAEGSSTYVEFPVMPNIEGTASGVIKLTYEDSNGDEVVFSKDFTAQVNSAVVMDPGAMDPGAGEVFNPTVATAKKAIVPIWGFVAIECLIFIIFIPITRKIIINVYKAKLRKQEENQY